MKFEVMKKAIPEECLRAFLNKETRYDCRKFTDSRQFYYTSNALDTFPNSSIGNLGKNKVIMVLKEQPASTIQQQQQMHSTQPSVQISIDCNTPEDKSLSTTYSLYAFINKIISNNLTIINNSSMSDNDNNKSFTLYISIESQDGNIYDTISLCLNRFLSKETEGIDFCIKTPYITKTYCVVNEILLTDPLEDEVKQSSFYFSIIKFNTGEVYFHKINGDFIKWDMMTSAANELLILQ